ncbi:uncharacterized protein LOC105689797 isoform X1 [Athalia rosae]|uniref:uncharacterized protein LOC105689797 isoform X1 n=3 Tax=Athalia rosae TaxID=37344 RepID=UPI002033A763|nr:uncharacterized protein LOC105689797 isoform X1 [Athalia rosae]XP_048508955.1 uncharacterized protein LOC105689797 isoform X1 [Athalia rosae]
MGNSKSQPCRPRRPMYLFYLIHRTWSVVVDHRNAGKEERYEDIDRETDLTSRCSGCAGCGYHQDSLFFESESEMAPNAEEELLAVKPWGPQPEKQERLRPPTYNAEDYAVALRRWGRRPVLSSSSSGSAATSGGSAETQNGTLPSTTSSSSGYASGSGEMTLRQFTSVSELLNKLRADLRLAFPSFVQEFASSPADGITLLLETLRGVQLAQNLPPSGQTGPRIGTRRAALDELGCVECLAACGERCADAPRLLIEAQPGLLALAVCLTSSLNRSRVLALQLLTRVCQAPGGHAAVSEAVSTLRLRYGEGGRFRFLAGALLAPSAAIVLRVAGVSFLNAFIKSAPRAQAKLYIQAEACEAGLEPKILQEWLTEMDSSVEESLSDLLRKEVHRWTRNCVDVEALQKRAARAEETCRMLGKKILSLQSQIENLQVENMNGYNSSHDRSKSSNFRTANFREAKIPQKSSSNADDEGISSSERSSTPEELKRDDQGNLKLSGVDNDQETTIDDVIEELRIIVKDAEEEYEDKNTVQMRKEILSAKNSDPKPFRGSIANTCTTYDICGDKNSSRPKPLGHPKTSKYSQGSGRTMTSCTESTQRCNQTPVTYFGNRNADPEGYNSSDSSATRKLSSNHSIISKSSTDGSLKITIKGPDIEEAIVPAILHPQPPKRSPPCLTAILAARNCAFADQEEVYNSPGDEVEEETLGDGSDSLLSASRLKYAQNEVATPFNMRSGVYGSQEEKPASSQATKSCEDLCNLKRETENKGEKKTIRNYDSGSALNSIVGTKNDQRSESRSFEAAPSSRRRLEQRAHSQSSEQSLRHGGQKYRSEVEKRKMLRRTSSQDCLSQKSGEQRYHHHHQKLKRSESGIESRIRKFESLNSFENLSLNSFSRPGSVDNVSMRQFLESDSGKGRMKRSESFHHISMQSKKELPSSRGGSDSGLFYVTNFDLEPVVTQPIKSESTKSPSLLTKSLDRIDEGLDSMVDIVLTEDKQGWPVHDKQIKEKPPKNSGKLHKSERSQAKGEKQLKSDEFYRGFNDKVISNKQLKSDELYDEKLVQKQWSYESELNNSRMMNSTSTENPLAMISRSSPSSRHESFCLDKSVGSKFSKGSNESGIYLPGRSYDAFGLSKSRFNAGKYSGNNLIPRDNHSSRHPIILPTTKHNGKVTDVLSGLY